MFLVVSEENGVALRRFLVDRVLFCLLSIPVANFILKMAGAFQERRDQLIFLINNYDMMLSVYNERTTATSVEVEEFQNLLRVRCR